MDKKNIKNFVCYFSINPMHLKIFFVQFYHLQKNVTLYQICPIKRATLTFWSQNNPREQLVTIFFNANELRDYWRHFDIWIVRKYPVWDEFSRPRKLSNLTIHIECKWGSFSLHIIMLVYFLMMLIIFFLNVIYTL